MTENEQNKAFSEAFPHIFKLIGNELHWKNGCEGECSRADILSDLNVIHVIEKTFTDAQNMDYIRILADVCEGTYYEDLHSFQPMPRSSKSTLISAEAEERAEATLRLIKFWKS